MRRVAAACVLAGCCAGRAGALLAGPPATAAAKSAPAAVQQAAPPWASAARSGVAQPTTTRLPATDRSWPGDKNGALLMSKVSGQAPLPPPGEPVAPGRAAGLGVTLEDVTQLALARHPQIRQAQAQVAAARGRALQASLYPNPTLGTASPQLAGNQTQYSGYIIQDLVTMGKIRLDTGAAERAAQQAEWMLVRARFDVLTNLRQRFYTALVAQQRIEILDRMVTIARTAKTIGERLLRAEIAPRGDVLLLQIELARSEAELRNANTLARTTKQQLAAATGVIDLPIERVNGDLRQRLPDYEVIAVEQGVIARNALVRNAEVEIARNQVVLRRQVVEPVPNLNFLGGYQNQLKGAFAPENQAIYQVQIEVPLFDRNQGNIRAAQADVSAANAQWVRVQTELANEAAAAIGRYLTSRQLAERYENEILPSAVELQRISAQLYEQEQIDFLRYLNAQRALLDANLAYLAAQEARWMAGAEVAGLLQSDRFP